jgi:hypothetical protein
MYLYRFYTRWTKHKEIDWKVHISLFVVYFYTCTCIMFGWLYIISFLIRFTIFFRGRRGRDLQLPMQSAVPITIDFVSSNLDQGYRCTTLCDKICQWLATGQWFSPGPPVSSNNKTDRHDITEILLKVALNTINLTNEPFSLFKFFS